MLQGCLAVFADTIKDGHEAKAIQVRGGTVAQFADGEIRMISHQSDSACYLMTLAEGTPEDADAIPTFYNPRELVAVRDEITCEMQPVKVAMIDTKAKQVCIIPQASDLAL